MDFRKLAAPPTPAASTAPAAATATTSGILPGSPEQEAIFDFVRTGKSHGVIDAVAGSGKSWTAVQSILRLKDVRPVPRIAVVAFNKHIADEMNNKFRAAGITFATASTYNSMGWRACMRAFRGVQLDTKGEKVARYISEIVDDRYGLDNLEWSQRSAVFGGVKQLVGLCKSYLLTGTGDDVDMLADKHNITLNGSRDIICDVVPRVLQACFDDTAVIDYDDQVWQTVRRALPLDRYDILFVDEYQDTSAAQLEMALLACPTGRIVAAGDTRQAIFGFRGAGIDATAKFEERLRGTSRGCERLPLTVTRRCPKSHVKLAQAIVPQIRAMDDAPEGKIAEMSVAAAVRAMKPGDLVICRVNAPLVGVCYDLIRQGTKAVVRGRDIGTNLRQLIDKLRAGDNIRNLLTKLVEWREKETAKLARLKEKGANKQQALEDRYECIVALCEGVNSVTALKAKIERIFADFADDGTPRDAVVLGTVHRTKGLEAFNVYVLAPELLPHPMAKQPWEHEQERNLAYVAATRAKYDVAAGKDGTLVFVQGKVPVGVPDVYYGGWPGADDADDVDAADAADESDAAAGMTDATAVQEAAGRDNTLPAAAVVDAGTHITCPKCHERIDPVATPPEEMRTGRQSGRTVVTNPAQCPACKYTARWEDFG